MQASSKLTATLPGQIACCKLPATLPGEVACCKLPGQVARQSCMLQVAWSSWQFASCQVKLANCKFSGQVSKLPASWQLQFSAGLVPGKLPAQVDKLPVIEWNMGPQAQLEIF